MKNSKLILTLIASLLLAGLMPRLFAGDSDTTTTITGTMVCAKCALHETKKCQNVVQVTKDGKTVNYYLKQNSISKAAHDNVCTGSEKVTVTGTVTEKDGKEMMTPIKIEPIK